MELHRFIIPILMSVLLLIGLSSCNPANNSQCPLGMSIIRSMSGPCHDSGGSNVYGCPKRPQAQCRSNFCNTASGNWFVKENNVERRLSRIECCDGENDCTGTSCGTTKCSNYPDAVCEVNPCGTSCGLRWFLSRERIYNGERFTEYIDVSDKCGVVEAVSGFSSNIFSRFRSFY